MNVAANERASYLVKMGNVRRTVVALAAVASFAAAARAADAPPGPTTGPAAVDVARSRAIIAFAKVGLAVSVPEGIHLLTKSDPPGDSEPSRYTFVSDQSIAHPYRIEVAAARAPTADRTTPAKALAAWIATIKVDMPRLAAERRMPFELVDEGSKQVCEMPAHYFVAQLELGAGDPMFPSIPVRMATIAATDGDRVWMCTLYTEPEGWRVGWSAFKAIVNAVHVAD